MASQVSIVDLPGSGKDDDKAKAKSSSSSRRGTRSTTKKSVNESDLKSRLTTVMGRIADAAEARGDDELAGTIRDDMDIMATGLVSLTRPLTALRTPLLLLLAIIEPVMAFSRIVRLMLGRAMTRRAEHADRATEEPPGATGN
jgi:hypothetical protein